MWKPDRSGSIVEAITAKTIRYKDIDCMYLRIVTTVLNSNMQVIAKFRSKNGNSGQNGNQYPF